ncbi:TnsA endonuclease N-terminal domain-containing protein [Paenibacillus pini]|uniref:S-layer homology domain protein n=1 Tax=Paenibacillus pini JCM 16418 TaxID=1236976 RepID=W7YRU6_9BACL|nr:TnsA endonuclease N-terminal domain-containing protein [Paenibacillus pini]GAF07376.1 S-layer homology domain protein [Paenibacillus pini JCM 16418]
MYSPVNIRKRNGKYGNNNWFSYSSKINRNVYLYSDLEYDHWILIEFDRQIVDFCEQPLHVEEYVEGEWINTVFDMWVKTTTGEEKFIEVKYACELDQKHEKFSSRSFRQINSQEKWCAAQGYTHEVHTDNYIYKNRTLISNYRKMLPYIDNRKVQNDLITKRLLNFLHQSGKQKLHSIEVQVGNCSKHEIREIVYNLIFKGILNSDLDKVMVGENMEVWLI